jgi:MFS transporter, DHA2 family, multidrug resistance protein
MLATLPLVFLASKIDTRVLVAFGFFVVAISSALQGYATTPQSSFETFMLPLILSGLGIVTLYIPLSIAVLGSTTPAQGPKASAFLNLALQLGGSIGVAGMSVFIHQRESFHSTILSAAATLGNVNVQHFVGSIGQLAALVYTQSTVLSYADATFMVSAIGLLSIPLVFLIRRPKRSNQPVEIAE